MTLQMNDWGLKQNGFVVKMRLVHFDKAYSGKWEVKKAICWQKGDECIVRLIDQNNRSFTRYFDNKEAGNNFVKFLITKHNYKKDRYEY